MLCHARHAHLLLRYAVFCGLDPPPSKIAPWSRVSACKVSCCMSVAAPTIPLWGVRPLKHGEIKELPPGTLIVRVSEVAVLKRRATT